MRAGRLRRWCARLAVMSALGAVPFGMMSAVVVATGSSTVAPVHQARPWDDPWLFGSVATEDGPPPPTSDDPSTHDYDWQ